MSRYKRIVRWVTYSCLGRTAYHPVYGRNRVPLPEEQASITIANYIHDELLELEALWPCWREDATARAVEIVTPVNWPRSPQPVVVSLSEALGGGAGFEVGDARSQIRRLTDGGRAMQHLYRLHGNDRVANQRARRWGARLASKYGLLFQVDTLEEEIIVEVGLDHAILDFAERCASLVAAIAKEMRK